MLQFELVVFELTYNLSIGTWNQVKHDDDYT
jgi:hypothetical protein